MTHQLTPGEIDPLARDVIFGLKTEIGVQETLDRLRDAGRTVAIVRTVDGDAPYAYAVLGFENVQKVFENDDDLPAEDMVRERPGKLFGEIVWGQHGEAHLWHRSVFGAPLIPRRVRERAQDVILPMVNRLIDGFAGRTRLDFVTEFAHHLPFDVISEMLAIPEEDREGLRLDVRRLFFFEHPDQILPATVRIKAYLAELIKERRKNPGDDVLSYMAHAELNGRRYTDDELADNARFLYPVAGENTMNSLATTLYFVLSQPGVLERVRANPEDRRAAVEESLRLRTPIVYIPRITKKPIVVDGVEIPAGSNVLLCNSSGNRDPERFANPTEFSLDRGPINHMTFGRGPHFCLGAHLARAENRVMLDAVLTRLPGLRLAPGQDFVFRGSSVHGLQSLEIEFDAVLPASAVQA